ncbi:MAG: hypothetical protein M1826_003433 [Phylliscum demangeonii]|nr:MAG: hypothetical protein M1826_003433 [Phylliscum demangeonii]
MQLFATPVAAGAAGTLLLAFAALHVAGTPLPASAAAERGKGSASKPQAWYLRPEMQPRIEATHDGPGPFNLWLNQLWGFSRDSCEELRSFDVWEAKTNELERQLKHDRQREHPASNTQAFITHQVAKAGHGLQQAMFRLAPLARKAEVSAAAAEKWSLAHGE